MATNTAPPSGRHLDAALAERVFGLRLEPGAQLDLSPHVRDERNQRSLLRFYSTNLNDAWSLLWRLRADGWLATVEDQGSSITAVLEHYEREEVEADGDTPAIAIARAVLAAVEAHGLAS